MTERSEDGSLHPIVMDFGLARESTEGHGLTESGAVMGTPAYMAPEQARGETRLIDRRSDVYSLGATLYDLIAGVPPFDAASIVDILIHVVGQEARPLRSVLPSVPPDLETIVMKCLNKEQNQRYDSAKALADDLGRFINGEPILGRRVSLVYRMRRWTLRHRALFAVSAASVVLLIGLLGSYIRQSIANQRERKRIAIRAELDKDLAQQIRDMEWLLRSARQLPLHDLEREKVIIRKRMAQLQRKLTENASLSGGLAHYALGRGHLALHEYPEALRELQQAIQLGEQSADLQYALGTVLGKHFEHAMYEARLSGGGDWARKQLKELEPKYLTPAIESLKSSRVMKTDAPKYLEGLIAYYQKDYDAALRNADDALRDAPWLYEASKLAGDVHLERALQTRDSGKFEDAEREFAMAVRSFSDAAAVGQSDSEVYEGLAEAWVRQIEMALNRAQVTNAAYAAAVEASDKLLGAEPRSVAGRLKKAYAALMTMALTGAGLTSDQRVKECLVNAEAVLAEEPENPYARDVAADCNAFAADLAQGKGKDPEPWFRKALGLLEPAVQKYPSFLWGLNDLASTYVVYASYLQLHGSPSVKDLLNKTLHYEGLALALDETYLYAYSNRLYAWGKLVVSANTAQEMKSLLAAADDAFTKCKAANSQYHLCDTNYLLIYARAAERALLGGSDPRPLLKQAMATLETMKQERGKVLDAEQHAALAYWVDASSQLQSQQDPHSTLETMKTALANCFSLAEKDAMCRTLAAKLEWVECDWLAMHHKPYLPVLKRALLLAEQATQSPEPYAEAWQVLANTHLRIARATGTSGASRDRELSAGLAAAEKIFTINPNDALGHATKGALELFRAESLRQPDDRTKAAQSAVARFQQAIRNDPFLEHDYAALFVQAKRLSGQ